MNPENSHILTINGGSSSIKFSMYQVGKPLERLLFGEIEKIGIIEAKFIFTTSQSPQKNSEDITANDHDEAINYLVDWLEKQ